MSGLNVLRVAYGVILVAGNSFWLGEKLSGSGVYLWSKVFLPFLTINILGPILSPLASFKTPENDLNGYPSGFGRIASTWCWFTLT